MNRTLPIISVLLVALSFTLAGCGGEKHASVPYGAITINAGPQASTIVARGEYQLRRAFAITPFDLGPSQYVVMDSVEAQNVVSFADFNGTSVTLDSLEPGEYSLMVYVSRLGVNQVTPDTAVSGSGDTTITDPTKGMPPYQFYFRPILIDSVRVAAGSIAEIKLADQLETWRPPAMLADGRWEAERVRYLKWRGATAPK